MIVRVPSAPALLAAALAVVLWFELRDRPAMDAVAPPPPPVAPAAAAPAPPPDPERPARFVATLLERPLFSPGRRPPAPPAAPAGGAAPAPKPPRVTGIVVTPAVRSATFAVDGGKPVVVGEGGRVGPFTVQSIRGGQVVVRGPDGERVLGPVFDPNAPVPPRAPAAQPAPSPPGGGVPPGPAAVRPPPRPSAPGGVPGLPPLPPPLGPTTQAAR